MCSHPEHRVEVLPDGQIAEGHVLTDEDMAELERLALNLFYSSYGHGYPQEVVLGGFEGTDSEE